MTTGEGVVAVRILIVDDEPAVHDAYRRSFDRPGADGALAAMAAELFDEVGDAPDAPDIDFALTHHRQGLDAVAEVRRSVADGDRFAVAFIDVRMPPGIDGRETAARIRALDPEIQIVIVTGYSDFSPLEISRVAGPADKIFYIAKPFEVAEIVQTATALSHRWLGDRELADMRAALADKVAQLEEQALELAANESKAVHMANHDVLTEAPNRLAFLRTLTEQVRGTATFAMAMIDLDRFKMVNDTLGHLAGDELIRMTCSILIEQIGDDGFVARLGGDEFGVLLPVVDEGEAVARCDRLVEACSTSFRVFGHSVQCAASVGVVIVAGDKGRDPVDVMRRADLALNEAKRSGRGVVRVFDESMDESIRFRRQIEGGLSQAIANGELSLVYQPIVARDGLEIVAFEALLRWNSPAYGAISPAMFIPIAEESNLIHELGDWVLDTALAMLPAWPGQYVSVNFSPRQFRQQNLVGHILDKVNRAGLAPDRLQIEITETAIFDDVDHAADTLYRLRQMGFRIALDDFGTGYSSLYNIRKFPLDALKIDQSFVEAMMREREAAAVVQAVVHLAQALGLAVIAEGVETAAQVDLLGVAGASHLQGFHFGRPMPLDQTHALVGPRPGSDRVTPDVVVTA